MELEKILNELQEKANILYAEYGATEEVIDLQIAINKFRNKFNIPDNTEFTEDNKGFVQ